MTKSSTAIGPYRSARETATSGAAVTTTMLRLDCSTSSCRATEPLIPVATIDSPWRSTNAAERSFARSTRSPRSMADPQARRTATRYAEATTPRIESGATMDLAFSSEETAFRGEIRAWIRDNLPAGWGTPAFKEPKTFDERLVFSRAWEKKLAEAGWAGISWPKEYGGRGATLMEQIIFHEEMAAARAPQIFINFVGINLAGPTMMAHGSEEQKKRYLPKILDMSEIWCQGFSEPNAGRDLANVQTKAVLDGDHFIVNGQKIWTSFAHVADWCLLLCRTDPTA